MQAADRIKFLAVLNGLAAMKPGVSKLTPEALDLWWNSMQHWTFEEFKSAASHLTRSIEFMPSPFHFEQLRKASFPTSGEAWIKALQNASSAIVCGQVTHGRSCGDPLVDRAVRAIGGYGVLAMTDSDKLCFLEKRFAEHYETMQEAEETRDAVPQIASTFRPRLSGGNGPKSFRHLLQNLTPEDAT